MNTFRVLAAIVFVSLSTGSIAGAEGDTEIDKIKQAAVDRCMSAAKERYGAAQAPSKPRKATISSKKGYKMSMKVGEKSKKKVVCHASNNGEVSFYSNR